MAYGIERVDVWSATINDKPGELAGKLGPLAEGGINLEFVMARRDKKGKGLVFMAPIKGAAQALAARKAGLKKSADLQAMRIEGADKAGLGTTMTQALADAGINVRGFTAMALGR